LIENYVTGVSKNTFLDQMVIFLLISLFVLLPFAVIDFSQFIVFFHRSLLIIVGILCVAIVLIKKGYKIKFNSTIAIFLIFFLHSAFLTLSRGSVFSLKEITVLFSLIFIAWWSKDVCINRLAKFIIGIATFYCLNVIYQNFNGSDFFGFVPRDGRVWGAFYYGAPAFGTFISLVFFLPFFFIRSLPVKLFIIAVFGSAMLLANDRAAILQTILAFLLFFPLTRSWRLLMIILAMAPMAWVTMMEPSASNRLMSIYMGLKLFLVNDAIALESVLLEYGMQGYLDIWGAVYNLWFDLENLFGVLFGSGFGIAPEVLGRFHNTNRPHQIHLELMINVGLIGFMFFLGWLSKFYTRHRKCFVIFAPAVLPFAFFSLSSANHLFLIMLSYIFCKSASNQWRTGDLIKNIHVEGCQRKVCSNEVRA